MLQIGIHYADVLTYLMGPVKAVRGQFAQLVLPGDNPDVASMILEHDNGALSTLNASYASASEYYLMNIYGKDATAFYDLHGGLRLLKRGEDKATAVPVAKNDTFVEELEEFAAACAATASPRSAASMRPSRSPWCARAFCRRAKAGGSRWRRFCKTTERQQSGRTIISAKRLDRMRLRADGMVRRLHPPRTIPPAPSP